MERAQNDVQVASVPSGFGQEAEITLADKEWSVFDGARKRRQRTNAPEDHFRQLAPRAADVPSPWRAADRALAEIADASRNDLSGAGKDRAGLERATTAIRDSLLEAAQAAAEASRRARSMAEMLDEALAILTDAQRGQMVPIPAIAGHSARGASQLSQREREVLLRVAEGRSNKAIAEDLYVSPNTVKTHVASLLRKLNVHTRAQLATIAVQQGLR